jgi:hypothetical protein
MSSTRPPCRSSISSFFLVCLTALAGCESAETEQAIEQETSNLRMLAPVLGGFISSHRGQYPANEQDLRKFLQQQGRNPDELLVSNRDGKPVVIIYQGDRAKVKGNLIAYEQEGKDGQRMTVDDLGVTKLMTDEELRKLVPGA